MFPITSHLIGVYLDRTRHPPTFDLSLKQGEKRPQLPFKWGKMRPTGESGNQMQNRPL